MDQSPKYTAAVVVEANKPVEYWKSSVVQPAAGGIRVNVRYAGVCGSDLHLWKGAMTFPMAYVLGHEGLGTIDALGEGVTTDHADQAVAIGDMVYWNNIAPCHHCYACTVLTDYTSCANYKIFWPAKDPTPASYTELSYLSRDNSFYKVSPEVPVESVVALGCALPTVLQAVDNLGGHRLDSTVVVQGAGAVGLAFVMLVKLAGARKIIVMELNQKRLEMAKRFGATDLIDFAIFPTRADRLTKIQTLVGSPGVDLVVEASGNLKAFKEGLNLLRRNGKYLVVGTWAGSGEVGISPFELVRKAVSIIGTSYAALKHYYHAVKLVERHHDEFPLTDCITHWFSLCDVQKAFEVVGRGEAVKAVVDFQD